MISDREEQFDDFRFFSVLLFLMFIPFLVSLGLIFWCGIIVCFYSLQVLWIVITNLYRIYLLKIKLLWPPVIRAVSVRSMSKTIHRLQTRHEYFQMCMWYLCASFSIKLLRYKIFGIFDSLSQCLNPEGKNYILIFFRFLSHLLLDYGK